MLSIAADQNHSQDSCWLGAKSFNTLGFFGQTVYKSELKAAIGSVQRGGRVPSTNGQVNQENI